MSEILISGKLPILALRGLAVFPGQTVHFDVGREKSVLAVEAAMKQDQNVFLIPQKNLLEADPDLDDLYAIGTVAKIKQVLRTQGENLRILVVGLCRGRISELQQREPYFAGQISAVPQTRRWIPPRARRCGGRRICSTVFSWSFPNSLPRPFASG